MIDIRIPSDVARLRDVVVGPVKPFSRLKLVLDSPPDLASLHQLRHNRVGIPAHERAAAQHAAFTALLEVNGVTVHHVDEVSDVTIQLYPRDIGVAVDDTFFLTRPRLAIRRREQAGLASLLPELSRVRTLEAGTIEGGDVIVSDGAVLVGLGEETNREGVESLRRAFDAAGIDREVVSIEFSHRGVVHLDTKFTLVAPGVGVYLPEAFTFASRVELERRFDLIAATRSEALDLDLNTLALSPGKVMVNAGATKLRAALEARGIEPVPVEYDEVTKFPGGLRCATLPLLRQP